jgi:hypothetical protein
VKSDTASTKSDEADAVLPASLGGDLGQLDDMDLPGRPVFRIFAAVAHGLLAWRERLLDLGLVDIRPEDRPPVALVATLLGIAKIMADLARRNDPEQERTWGGRRNGAGFRKKDVWIDPV